MKNHGQNSPQTIRGLRERRSLRGLLDTRKLMEADLRDVEYVGPFGKGFHRVKNLGGTTEFIVADQTGGRTFATGAVVLSGSTSGSGGEAILGGSSAGKKGGVQRTVSRRRRGTTATTGDSNQYAFGYDGLGNMLALLYQDGAYVSTRLTATASAGSITGCILTDSSLLVGDGSAIFQDGSTLKVWDVEGAAVHTYSVPAGWTTPSQAHYQNGFLYWCEIEDVTNQTTFDVRLRKSDTDLGNVSTLATFTSPDAVVDYGVPWIQWRAANMIAFAADVDGAVCYVENVVDDGSGALDWHGLQIRFTLAGSSAFREFDTPELGCDGTNLVAVAAPLPAATIGATSFAFAQPIAGVQSVISKADDSSTPAANLWGASDLDSIAVSAFNVGTGGATLQVHSYSEGKILRGISSGTVITSAIDAFDATPNYPAAMFYSGM